MSEEPNDIHALAGVRPSLEHPELYRRLLDTLAEGVSLADAEGVIVYTNPAQDQMFGYGPGELNGRHISVLNGYDAEQNTEVLEAVTNELRRTGAWKGEWLNRRKDGGRFYSKTRISIVDIAGRSHWLSIQEDISDEHARDAALRDRELRLELATQAADMGVWDWDLATNLFVYSARAREICGFAADGELTLEDIVAVTHPDDYPFTSAQAARAMDPSIRASEPYRYRLLRRDGAVRWVIAHGRVVFDETTNPAQARRYIGTLQDVTDAHLLEMQLRESEARFRAMADSTPAPAWVTNCAGSVVFANQAFAEVAGVEADALLGDSWLGLLHADDLPRVGAQRAQAWAAGYAPYSFEARFKDPSGGWRWMRVATRPRFDAAGVFQGYVGIAVDMSEAKRAEEELRVSADRLRLAVASANAGDWSWDLATGMLDLSRAAADITGLPARLSAAELQGLMHEGNRRALQNTAEAGVTAEGNWEIELYITRPNDKKQTWIAVRGQATRDEAGALTGMIGLISDISERKKRDETERLLVREVDHRAKNVLAVVQALARLTPFATREQYLSDFGGRVNALGRVHALLSQNLWRDIDLAALIGAELAPLQAAYGDRVTFDGPVLAVASVAAQPLGQIIHELAMNAFKHGALAHPRGQLKVHWTEASDNRVCLTWHEGAGEGIIAPDKDGFGARLIEGALRQVDGRCRRVWASHGLTCTIEFRARALEPGVAASDRSSVGSDGDAPAKPRLLIVDDEPLIAMDLAAIAETAGYIVVGPANTFEEAQNLAEAEALDAALIDVNLGGRDSAPIRALLMRRGVPFAVVTGYGDAAVDQPVLQKPITSEQVVTLLDALRR